MKKLIKQIERELFDLRKEEKKNHFQRFFKTGVGQYGYGDKFLGIDVPTTRSIVKKYQPQILLENIFMFNPLLENEYHEIRSFALMMLVGLYQKNPNEREKIYQYYCSKFKHINNWDLVDLSCRDIVGHYLYEIKKDDRSLFEYALSENIWIKRISIVSTWYFIKQHHFEPTIKISQMLIGDKEDLIHKAVGWMLREMGKRDIEPLYAFLDAHHKTMPRTALRYAIEKLTDKEKKHYMQK